MARLVSRSTRKHARAPPSVPNGLIPLVDACVHTHARAGMSRPTSAQLRSTCALDQTPAASACGVRGLQGQVLTVLRYWECAMAGWRARWRLCQVSACTAVPADQQDAKVRLDRPRSPPAASTSPAARTAHAGHRHALHSRHHEVRRRPSGHVLQGTAQCRAVGYPCVPQCPCVCGSAPSRRPLPTLAPLGGAARPPAFACQGVRCCRCQASMSRRTSRPTCCRQPWPPTPVASACRQPHRTNMQPRRPEWGAAPVVVVVVAPKCGGGACVRRVSQLPRGYYTVRQRTTGQCNLR